MGLTPPAAGGPPTPWLRAPWLHGTLAVACDGHEHRVTLGPDGVTLHDHGVRDIARSRAAEARAPGAACACVRVLLAWERHDAALLPDDAQRALTHLYLRHVFGRPPPGPGAGHPG
jgi:hypothetical protein